MFDSNACSLVWASLADTADGGAVPDASSKTSGSLSPGKLCGAGADTGGNSVSPFPRSGAVPSSSGGIPASNFVEGMYFITDLLRDMHVGIAATDVETRIHTLEAHIKSFPSVTSTSLSARPPVTLQQLLLFEDAASISAQPRASDGASTQPRASISSSWQLPHKEKHHQPTTTMRVCVHHLLLALEFTERWLVEIELDESLSRAVRTSYGATLAKRHPLPLRIAVNALSHLLGSKRALMKKIEGSSPYVDTINSAAARSTPPPISERLALFAGSVHRVRVVLDAFVKEHALDIE